jgi:hypothetical protein
VRRGVFGIDRERPIESVDGLSQPAVALVPRGLASDLLSPLE